MQGVQVQSLVRELRSHMLLSKKKKKRVIKRTKDGSDQRPYRRKEGAMIIPGEKHSRQKEQGVVCAHIRVGGEGLKRNPWK